MKNILRDNKAKSIVKLFCASVFFWVADVVYAEGNITQVNDIIEQALSHTPNLEQGKMLYRSCAACHTPEAWGTPTGRFPQLAGQHQRVLLKQLADIHLGNRDNPTMVPFTNAVFANGSQALANVTAYISQLPMVPNNSIGYGMGLEEGKQLYADNCVKCHGENGQGDSHKFYPRIHGQHFNYLLRQLQWIKAGKRRNADEKMVRQIANFSQEQLVAIADYVSRLKPDSHLLADHPDWRNPDFRAGFISAPNGMPQ